MHSSVQPQSGLPVSPLQAYETRIAEGTLDKDEVQHRIMARLDALHRELGAVQKQGFMEKFLARDIPAPRSIYIWGPVGRGKSMLMDLFYNSLGLPHAERVHFHAFMQKVHAMMHERRQEIQKNHSNTDAFALVLSDLAVAHRIVCLDELQVTDVADAMILGRLFAELLKAGVTFVITSNRPPGELYKGGLQREQFMEFVRLIETRMEVLELASPKDYRMQQLRTMDDVYISPLSEKADAILEEKFSQMTHRAKSMPVTLEVQGRQLHVERSYGGLALFTFGELCEKPLGAADYLAIASHFHMVFIRDIPLLGPEKRNESKRFVTLIDTLYDRRVKLICTAAAAPEALYVQGDGVFEFARTVSRLAEMRSGQYLQLAYNP